MRKQIKLLLVAAIAATTIFACKKDDDSNSGASPSNSSIIGTWELKNHREVTKLNGVVQEDTTEAVSPGETIVEFKTDGTVLNKGSLDSGSVVKYSVSGSKITLIDGTDTSIFNLSISGNDMSFNDSQIDTLNTNPLMIYSYDFYMNFKRK